MNKKSKAIAGFTLIELMIIVAIIGILVGIALPNYQNYVKKSRIAEATSALSDYRVKYEQYFMDNKTWPASNACIASTSSSSQPSSFIMSCTSTATTYTITATGNGIMNGFTYNIDQSNSKTSRTPGSGGATLNCWIQQVVSTGASC